MSSLVLPAPSSGHGYRVPRENGSVACKPLRPPSSWGFERWVRVRVMTDQRSEYELVDPSSRRERLHHSYVRQPWRVQSPTCRCRRRGCRERACVIQLVLERFLSAGRSELGATRLATSEQDKAAVRTPQCTLLRWIQASETVNGSRNDQPTGQALVAGNVRLSKVVLTKVYSRM